jgi:hypothetical protein
MIVFYTLARALSSVFVVLALTSQSVGFYALPTGWTEIKTSDVWVITSPKTETGAVGLILTIARPVQGGFAPWLASTARSFVETGLGRIVDASPVVRAPGIRDALSFTIAAQDDVGDTIYVHVVSYRTSAGAQVIYLISPASMGFDDPRIKQASTYINGLRDYNFGLTSAMLGADEPVQPRPDMPQAAPAPATTKAASGSRCRDVARPHQEAYTEQVCGGYSGGVRNCSTALRFRTITQNVRICD